MKKSKIENSLELFFFCRKGTLYCPKGLGPPVGVRDPLRRGPGFLLLFSIKSKEEILCFAEKVLNWRSTDVAQANFWLV